MYSFGNKGFRGCSFEVLTPAVLGCILCVEITSRLFPAVLTLVELVKVLWEIVNRSCSPGHAILSHSWAALGIVPSDSSPWNTLWGRKWVLKVLYEGQGVGFPHLGKKVGKNLLLIAA